MNLNEKILQSSRTLIIITNDIDSIDKDLKNGSIIYDSNTDIYYGVSPESHSGEITKKFLMSGIDNSISGDFKIKGSLIVEGDLGISGDNTIIDTSELKIEDNTIELNKNETGDGVTLETAGVEINRGTKEKAAYAFVEKLKEDLAAFVLKVGDKNIFSFREDGEANIPSIKTSNIMSSGNIESFGDIKSSSSTVTNNLEVGGESKSNSLLTGDIASKNISATGTISASEDIETDKNVNSNNISAKELISGKNVSASEKLSSPSINSDNIINSNNISSKSLDISGESNMSNLGISGNLDVTGMIDVVEKSAFHKGLSVYGNLYSYGRIDSDGEIITRAIGNEFSSLHISNVNNEENLEYGKIVVDGISIFKKDMSVDGGLTVKNNISANAVTANSSITGKSTLSILGASNLHDTEIAGNASVLGNIDLNSGYLKTSGDIESGNIINEHNILTDTLEISNGSIFNGKSTFNSLEETVFAGDLKAKIVSADSASIVGNVLSNSLEAKNVTADHITSNYDINTNNLIVNDVSTFKNDVTLEKSISGLNAVFDSISVKNLVSGTNVSIGEDSVSSKDLVATRKVTSDEAQINKLIVDESANFNCLPIMLGFQSDADSVINGDLSVSKNITAVGLNATSNIITKSLNTDNIITKGLNNSGNSVFSGLSTFGDANFNSIDIENAIISKGTITTDKKMKSSSIEVGTVKGLNSLTSKGLSVFEDMATFNGGIQSIIDGSSFGSTSYHGHVDILAKDDDETSGKIYIERDAHIGNKLTADNEIITNIIRANKMFIEDESVFNNRVIINDELLVVKGTSFTENSNFEKELSVNSLVSETDALIKGSLSVNGPSIFKNGATVSDGNISVDNGNVSATNITSTGTVTSKDINSTGNATFNILSANSLEVENEINFSDINTEKVTATAAAINGPITTTGDNTFKGLSEFFSAVTIHDEIIAEDKISTISKVNANLGFTIGDYLDEIIDSSIRLNTNADKNIVFNVKNNSGANRGFVFANSGDALFDIGTDKIRSNKPIYINNNGSWSKVLTEGLGSDIDAATLATKSLDIGLSGKSDSIALYDNEGRVANSKMLQGHTVGSTANSIPINNGVLNTGLNSEKLCGKTPSSDSIANTLVLRDNNKSIKVDSVRLPGLLNISSNNDTIEMKNGSDYASLTIKDLTVKGTSTIINSEEVNISDSVLLLNSNVDADTAPTENSGIEVNRGSESNSAFLWNEELGEWICVNSDGISKRISLEGHTHSLSELGGAKHANSHAKGGSDEITPNSIGAIKSVNVKNVEMYSENDLPDASIDNIFDIYVTTDTQRIFLNKGTELEMIGGQSEVEWSTLASVPEQFNPVLASTSTVGGVKIGKGLSINPDGKIDVVSSADAFIIKKESFVSTQGQTDFVLTTGTYNMGVNTLWVYVNGMRLPKDAYTEVNESTVRLTSNTLDSGNTIEIEYYVQHNIAIVPDDSDKIHGISHLENGDDKIPNASELCNGLMSKDDKTNINSIKLLTDRISIDDDSKLFIDNKEFASSQSGGQEPFIHEQLASSDKWVIAHNLNRYLSSILCTDLNDNVIIPGNIHINDKNTITITFTSATNGKVYVN